MSALRRRRVPCLGAVLLVLILGTTHLERRLAETNFNDDFGCFLAAADSVDGDEILSRLISLNDAALPEAPRDAGALVALVPVDGPTSVVGAERTAPGSRAPPAVVA